MRSFRIRNIYEKIVSFTMSKWQVKLMLAAAALVIVFAVIAITKIMVDDLVEREQNLMKYYAQTYEYYSELEDIDDFWFFIEHINPSVNFTVIQTDENDEPIVPFEDYSLNVEIDTTLTLKEQREQMYDLIDDMGSTYDPIEIIVEYEDDVLIQKFYYTNSSLVRNLRFFPVIAIIIMGAFIVIGYLAFSNIRRSEESKVWVGMAKEAAHQLGTPLSSLMAWIEIVKMNRDNPEYLDETIGEMQNDIARLSKITTRFSKIGSMPEMKVQSLAEVIERVCQYFEKRLPHLGKKVEIIRNLDYGIEAQISVDLFEWVIENLLKNAAEAIEERQGNVYITLQNSPKWILINVRDTGKGMTPKQRRQVFNPGFTTKKRGWGLGLSLVKRIIGEYHKGKIYIKDTSPGKGTTFRIELPLLK